MRFVSLTLLSLLTGLGAAATAHAQCLTPAERAELQTALEGQLAASDWDNPRLFQHAFSRLGPGVNPRRSDGYDPSMRGQRAELARRVVAALHGARAPRHWVGRNLAAIEDPRQANPRVFRAADQTLDEAYSEVRNANLEVVRLRDALAAATDPMEQAELRAALLAAQRTRNRINRDLRTAAQAYRVALLTSGANLSMADQLNEFWSNHFNVDARKATWSAIDYQKTLRSQQCGTFYDLLESSAKHPAMLIYLDNFRSRRGRINENYGRELLELHTLGDDTFQFYSQEDVVDAARALTGWGVGFTEVTPGMHHAEFRFYRGGHVQDRLTLFDTAPRGTPLVLDPINDANGNPTPQAVERGEALLRYLAGHISTRRNICRKLSKWFLGIAPNHIVNGCAAPDVWGTDGDLTSIYAYLLTRPEMFHSVDATGVAPRNTFRVKERNPFELVVAAYRAAGRPAFDLDTIRAQIAAAAQLGIAPAQYPPPTGYPDERGWLSPGLLIRYNAFLHGAIETTRVRLQTSQLDLQGAALETWAAGRVQRALDAPDAATRNARLDALSSLLIARAYGAPENREAAKRALRTALLRPDIDQTTNAPAPVRTHLHTFLGHAVSVRK